MFNLIFGAPWWLLLTLAGVGVVVAWSGLKRQDGRTRNVGLGLIGLVAVLLVAGHFVETDQQKVKRLNAEMVQSVPGQDWSKFADLLDGDVTLKTTTSTIYTNRAALVAGAKDNVVRWGLRSVTITNADLKQDGSTDITVSMSVLSKQDSTEGFFAGGVPSTWEMIWDRTESGWHCHQITCLGVGSEKSGSVGRYFK